LNGKTHGDLKRISKMTQNFQKKISSLSPNKSYASAVIEHTEHTDTNISINPHTSSSCANNTTSQEVPSECNSTEKSPDQKESLVFEKHRESSAVNSIANGTPERIPRNNGRNIHSPDTSPLVVSSSDTCYQRLIESPNVNTTNRTSPERSVKYNRSTGQITVDKPRIVRKTDSKHQHTNVFRGVRYKKAARYFLSGINKESTYEGIANFVENKGVQITHLALFKPRGRYSFRTAKINVLSQC
jgi:hypothetical protein